MSAAAERWRCAAVSNPRKRWPSPRLPRGARALCAHPIGRSLTPNSLRPPAPRQQLQSGLADPRRRRATCPRRRSFSTMKVESGSARWQLPGGAPRLARRHRSTRSRRRAARPAGEGCWVAGRSWGGGGPAWARPRGRARGRDGRRRRAEDAGRSARARMACRNERTPYIVAARIRDLARAVLDAGRVAERRHWGVE